MILLCDEDVGTSVPKAPNLVGCETKYMRKLGWAGKPDVEWLSKAGQNEWLVFSYNKKKLKVPSERETIIREKVGIIFLTIWYRIYTQYFETIVGEVGYL